MKTYTFKNTFHNTEARTTLHPEEIREHIADKYQKGYDPDKNTTRKINRMNRKLCGISDCVCGWGFVEVIDPDGCEIRETPEGWIK